MVKLQNFLLFSLLAKSSMCFAVNLDLDSLGGFTLGGHIAPHQYIESGLTDGDINTYGLDGGVLSSDQSSSNYSLRYDFDTPTMVQDLMFYIAFSESRESRTYVFTTEGTLTFIEPDLSTFTGYLSYDIDSFVTHIHFQSPYSNRYDITEIVMTSGATTGIPEPATVLFFCIAGLIFALRPTKLLIITFFEEAA